MAVAIITGVFNFYNEETSTPINIESKDKKPVIILKPQDKGTAFYQEEGGTVITNIYNKGKSEKEYQDLADELQVTKETVKGFFEILGEKKISQENLKIKLIEIANSYKRLGSELKSYTSEDPEVVSLKKQAHEAWEKFELGLAEDLLRQASEKDKEAIQKQKNRLDSRLISRAKTMSQLGWLKRTQLAYAEAAGYYREASELVPQHLKKERIYYLGGWGQSLLLTLDYVGAEPPLKEALKIAQSLNEQKDLEVGVLNTLGKVLLGLGWVTQSIEYLEHAKSLQKSAQGNEIDKFYLPITLNNLAQANLLGGKLAESIKLQKESNELVQRLYGEKHQDIATGLINLAQYQLKGGDYAEAIENAFKAIKLFESTLGQNHPETGTAYSTLADIYRQTGNYLNADSYYQKAIRIIEDKWGHDSAYLGGILNNYALNLVEQERYSEAELQYDKTIKLVNKSLHPHHQAMAIYITNRGELYLRQGKLRLAKDEFEKALKILDDNDVGPNHPDRALIYHDLGDSNRLLKNFPKAKEFLTEAARIRENTLGPHHLHLGKTLVNLGFVNLELENYDEAESNFHKVGEIFGRLIGKCSKGFASSVLAGLEKVYQKTGKKDLAARIADRIEAITIGKCIA